MSANKRSCACCKKQLSKVPGIKKVLSLRDVNFHEVSLAQTFAVGDVICAFCRRKAHRKGVAIAEYHTNSDSTSDDENGDPSFSVALQTPSEEDYVELPLQRTIATHRYCFICSKECNIQSVPKKARLQVYTTKNIYIPAGNRCCPSHLVNDRVYEEDLNQIIIHSNKAKLKVTEITEMFKTLSIDVTMTQLGKIEKKCLPHNQLSIFTGYSYEQIEELEEELVTLRNSSERSTLQAIVIFLVKLRTGCSNALIYSMLQLQREQMVSDYSSSVLKAFECDILPYQFGIDTHCRQWLIDCHTTDIAKKLFNAYDCLILICDGTYAYHQKSDNNEYQRKSFSGQKKKHLCKPFTVCATDGFVIDMLGPFHANENDASILRKVIDTMSNILQPGDIFVLDRGFRDVVALLEAKGYRVMMPSIKGQRKQLSTTEANQSRYVTKVRWVVEAVHGILKNRFKLLDHTLDNKMLPKIKSYYRIASYLLNRFGKPLVSDTDMNNEIFERMSTKQGEENELAQLVDNKGWYRKKLPFQYFSSNSVKDFPELTETELKVLCTGTYQFGQAICYLGEVLNEDGTLNMAYVKEQTSILKVQIQSRHMSKKVYKCFIKYNPQVLGINSIEQYCCECANGLRTVGCCSHVAAVIYYLSYGRYLSKIPRPNEKLSSLFQNDTNVTINVDSDED